MSLFDTGVRPAIDAHLLKLAAEKRDYGPYWSASSAGYCMRKTVFERLGVPYVEKDDDARKQRLYTSGHIFHNWVQGITKEAGLSIASEVELQDEDLMIRGHFDDLVLVKQPIVKNEDVEIVMIPPKPHLILYDYKTVNSQSFKYRNDLSYYHKMQLGTYMYMLRKHGLKTLQQDYESDVDFKARKELRETAHNLTEARILLISKDDLRMKEQQLMWDDKLEKEIVGYWTALNTYWNDKKIPPCTCADHENGFLAKEKWNPYFYKDEPCSLDWYLEQKEAGNLKEIK